MHCPHCKSIIDNNAPRCHHCGKSLIRKGHTHSDDPADDLIARNRARDKRVNLIAKVMMGGIYAVVGLAVIAFLMVRCSVFHKSSSSGKYPMLEIASFDIIKDDDGYNKKHNTEGKLIVHIKTTNFGSKRIRNLDTKIRIMPTNIHIGGSNFDFNNDIYHIVAPPQFIDPGNSIITDLEFPVLRDLSHLVAKLEIEYEVVLLK